MMNPATGSLAANESRGGSRVFRLFRHLPYRLNSHDTQSCVGCFGNSSSDLLPIFLPGVMPLPSS